MNQALYKKQTSSTPCRRVRSAFSLVELLTVMAILSALIGIGALSYLQMADGFAFSLAQSQISAQLNAARTLAVEERKRAGLLIHWLEGEQVEVQLIEQSENSGRWIPMQGKSPMKFSNAVTVRSLEQQDNWRDDEPRFVRFAIGFHSDGSLLTTSSITHYDQNNDGTLYLLDDSGNRIAGPSGLYQKDPNDFESVPFTSSMVIIMKKTMEEELIARHGETWTQVQEDDWIINTWLDDKPKSNMVLNRYTGRLLRYQEEP